MKNLSVQSATNSLRRKKQFAKRYVPMPNPLMEQVKRDFHKRYQETIQKVFMRHFIHVLKEKASETAN